MSKKEKPKKEAPAAEGAEAPEGVEGEAAPGKKKLPLKLLIIAGVALVVVLGGGGTTAFMLLKPKPAAAAAGAEKAKPKKKEAKKKEEKGGEKGGEAKTAGTVKEGPDGVVFYTMPDLMANMQTADGRPTFLKLKVTFELPDDQGVEVLENNMPRLQDMFQTFMRELRHEDVAGSQGNYTLRMEIQRRVNLVIAPSKVNAVLLEEMLEK